MTRTIELEGLPLDRRQALAYEEWCRLSSDDRIPLQRDFRPDRIANALPAAVLVHVEHGNSGIRFRQRLEGRFVALAFGEGTGRTIDEIYTDEHLFHLMPRYLEVAYTGDPAMTECSVPQNADEDLSFTRLLLPFAGPDGKVNRLLMIYRFDPVALARLPAPLPVRRESAPVIPGFAPEEKYVSRARLAETRKAG